jgi:hypothetical protein
MTSIFENIDDYDKEIKRVEQVIKELEETADSVFYQIPDEKIKEAVIARRDGMLNDLKGIKGLFVYQKASIMTDYYDTLLMQNQEVDGDEAKEE